MSIITRLWGFTRFIKNSRFLLEILTYMVYNKEDKKTRKVCFMNILTFLLAGESGGMESWISIAFLALMFLAMWFFMIRPQKKQEKKDQAMREALQVGDEVTTIGGIIGKVVSIKEGTFVLESTKDKTHIRFLVGAIRSVDVKISDVVAAKEAEAETTDEAN